MHVTRTQDRPAQVAADAVVVGLFAESKPSGAAAEIDTASGGALSRLLATKEATGKLYELTTLLVPAGVKAPCVIVVGLGPQAKLDAGSAFRASAAAARHLAGKPRGTVANYLAELAPALTESLVCGALVGCVGQDLYRAEKNRHAFANLLWAGGDDALLASGQILAEGINLTRHLVNQPPDVIYPETFAKEAAAVASKHALEIEVWDEKRLAAEKCGSLLAVNKGSDRPARLVVLQYHGGKAGAAPLAIVGKGVTFDSGGLSLKPPDGMLTMKCDMAGAATMLGAMQTIARLKLPVNVVGLAGLVENMTGPAAMKLGDVLHARSGKTIEVHNTDAEGRLVLADVLNVALDYKPAAIVDLATLTGACVVALGTEVAGAMTNDQPLCDRVLAAAAKAGEPLWQLPMWPEIYDEVIRGEVADIKNVGDGRWGGAISAAKFLEQFVAGKPWTHLDIAGPAFRDKPKPYAEAGASGQFVRTLVELARAWK